MTELNNPEVLEISRGMNLHQSGDVIEARKIYLQILSTDANQFDANHMLGVAEVQLGNVEVGLSYLNKAINLDPSNPIPFSNLASALIKINRFDEALLNTGIAISLRPDFSDAYLNRSEAYRHLLQWDRALESAKNAVQYNASNPIASYAVGLAYQGSGLHSQAIESFAAALKLNANYIDAYVARAASYRAIGEFELALNDLLSAGQLQPGNLHILTSLSFVYLDKKEFPEAQKCFENILAKEFSESVWVQYAELMLNLNLSHLIVDSLRKAITLAPQSLDLLRAISFVLERNNFYTEALSFANQALKLKGDDIQFLLLRSRLLQHLRQSENALNDINHAIFLEPTLYSSYEARGHFFLHVRSYELAVDSFSKAIFFEKNKAGLFNDRGTAYSNLRMTDKALADFDRALELDPDFIQARSNRANSLRDLKRLDEAQSILEELIIQYPNFAEAKNNLGAVLVDRLQTEAALKSFDAAIAANPLYADAYSNSGAANIYLGRFEEAKLKFTKALEIAPDHADAHWNLALCDLTCGNLENGWKEYEWRWKNFNLNIPADRRAFVPRLWHSEEELRGRSILLYAEQGLGDVIQFVRYVLPLLAKKCRVYLEAPASLIGLLRTLTDDTNFSLIPSGEPLPVTDFVCPLLSLPGLLGTRLETIPSYPHYLFADAQKALEWSERLKLLGSKKRIGVAWSGSTTHANDKSRSITLEKFSEMMESNSIDWVSLQKEIRDTDVAMLERLPQLKWYGDLLTDFSDTAALCANLDLIISVDTSVVHLGAAMGKPVWCLLSHRADWRWLLKRADSPWYPTITLVRQETADNWDGVISQIKHQLIDF